MTLKKVLAAGWSVSIYPHDGWVAVFLRKTGEETLHGQGRTVRRAVARAYIGF